LELAEYRVPGRRPFDAGRANPIIGLGISNLPRWRSGVPSARTAASFQGARWQTSREIVSGEYKFGFHDEVDYLEETKAGLTRETVEAISRFKNEPQWMLDFRLRAYEHFLARPMPMWAAI